MVSPKTMHKQVINMDSACCTYVFIYIHTIIIVKEKHAINLKVGTMEGELGGAREKNKRGKLYKSILVKNTKHIPKKKYANKK